MKGIARFEARLEAIEIGKKPALDSELRAVLDTLGPTRTVALSQLAIEGKDPDMDALEALEPSRMTTLCICGPRCCVCGKPGIKRPGSLPICDECYTFTAGPDSINWQ